MQEFIQAHGINKERFAEVMRAAFMDVLVRTSGERDPGAKSSFSVIVNPDTADIQILRRRTIVMDDEVEDEARQIPLSEALEKDPEATPGEDFFEEIPLHTLSRMQVEQLKNRLRQQLRDLDRQALYERYIHMVGEIITGEVLKVTRDELIILHEGNELSLPKKELIPNKDNYIPKDSAPSYRRDKTASSV
ncbi:MAG: hypothetical protein NZ933_09135, partial [Bacteroidia bacterium]|nr:hypothetical protein [Bacteroidia bacterium]